MCVGLHLTPRQSTCWGQMQGHSLHDVRDMLCKEKCQSSEPLPLTCIKCKPFHVCNHTKDAIGANWSNLSLPRCLSNGTSC